MVHGAVPIYALLKDYWKEEGSVPLRPREKIRKFESQNVVHCLVSMCPSMY